MDAPLNLLDALLLGLFAYAIVRGFLQGALSQLAAFGGGATGLVAGALFAPAVARLFVAGPSPALSLVTLALLMLTIMLGQGIGLAVGLRLRRAAERVGAGTLDRGAGMVVGAAGLVVAVWLLGAVLAQGPLPPVAQQVRSSRVVALIHEQLPPAPDLFGRVSAYLDDQGFPQVFADPRGAITATPVPPTSAGAVQAAAAAGQDSAVQVQATGCGGISFGSGVVTRDGYVVTNAHVVAGGERVVVRDLAGSHEAVPVLLDDDLDLAVLSVPDAQAPPIGWSEAPAGRGTEGATLGFPGGQRDLVVKPATVRGRGQAVGRDIYGSGRVTRTVLELSAGETRGVERGDSGGPFVTAEGLVGGVVFAADAAEPGSGFALAADQVRDLVDAAIARGSAVGTGPCRF